RALTHGADERTSGAGGDADAAPAPAHLPPGGPWARRPLHLARDAAPAGDVGLPAAVGADAVLHELLRHVERAGRVRRVRELRGDPDVPGGPPASADDAGLRGRG